MTHGRIGLAAGGVLLFILLLPAQSTAAPIPMVFTYGERISHLGDVNRNTVPPSSAAAVRMRLSAMTRVGYKYSYAGLFWISFLNWGGSYCLYDGSRYLRITEQDAAALIGRDAVGAPIRYRIPLGWVLVGVPLGALFVLARISRAREEARIKQATQDVRYQRALEILQAAMAAQVAKETELRQNFEQQSRGISSTTHPRGAPGIWIADSDTNIEAEWVDDVEHGVAARQIRAPEGAVGARGAIAGNEFRIDSVLQVGNDEIVYQLTNIHTGKFVGYGFSGDWYQSLLPAAT